MNRKSDAVYAMVQGFKHRGVPIDGVGLEMHITPISTQMHSRPTLSDSPSSGFKCTLRNWTFPFLLLLAENPTKRI